METPRRARRGDKTTAGGYTHGIDDTHNNPEGVTDHSVTHMTYHTAPHSRSMCAWYVIKAMWHGGCPIGLVPAYAYDKTLPQMGFEEIPSKGYVPQKGDITVLPQNEESSFGHIAIYNGSIWVSDY